MNEQILFFSRKLLFPLEHFGVFEAMLILLIKKVVDNQLLLNGGVQLPVFAAGEDG